MILVTGATGHTGRAAVDHLVRRGQPVRIVTRDPEHAATIPELSGAAIHVGDASDPSTLEAAFRGVDKLYLVPPTFPGWDRAEAQTLDLAVRSGVQHVVRISALGTAPDAASMSLSFHWKGERRLERSGLGFTHIRANSFFQNTLFDAPSIRASGVFAGCVGALRFAKVDTRDIGEVVATVLTEPGHGGAAYTLTGPEALSYDDLAATLSEVLGRAIRYADMAVEEYSQFMIREGFPQWLADEFAAIYGLGFEDGSVVEDVTGTIEAVLGRAPRTFAEFVADYRSEFE